MKRREFCRQLTIVGGTVMITPLLNACRGIAPSAESAQVGPGLKPAQITDPTATPLPTATNPAATHAPTGTPQPDPTGEPMATATPETDVATIALVRTTDRTFGVQRAIELLAINPSRGLPVLLKPNFNSADAAPASTHMDTLQALILALQDQGARSITIGERSGMGDTRQVMGQIGVFDLESSMGVNTAVFDELSESEWVVRQDSDFHWPDGFAVPRMLLDSPCVVQTCNLKTHGYGGHFTMSLKNSVGFVAKTVPGGGVNYMRQLHDSTYQRPMIAEVNNTYVPSLIVIDGVEAFITGGPDKGTLVQPGVVLAGTDRIALDAVGVALLRLFGGTPEVSNGEIFAQEQIARAVELGLGIDSPTKIRFITGDADSQAYADLITSKLN